MLQVGATKEVSEQPTGGRSSESVVQQQGTAQQPDVVHSAVVALVTPKRKGE